MAAVDDILGAGLDIEGWSYHKHEVAAKVAGKKYQLKCTDS